MKQVEMKKVVSSNIEAIGYSETRKLLFVRFLGGSMYVYKDAPKVTYEGLLASPSVGSSLKAAISGLGYVKVPPAECDAMLTEPEIATQEEATKGTEPEKVQTAKREVMTNLMGVLLGYYQGHGDVVDKPVKSLFGNDLTVGEKVYAVIKRVGSNSVLMPVKKEEMDLLDARYYAHDLIQDEEGVGIPVIMERGIRKVITGTELEQCIKRFDLPEGAPLKSVVYLLVPDTDPAMEDSVVLFGLGYTNPKEMYDYTEWEVFGHHEDGLAKMESLTMDDALDLVRNYSQPNE